MKQIIPALCPVLFAVFTLLSLFAQNQTEVELSLLWRPLAVCVVVALALFGVFRLITRDSAKAGVLASLVVIAFFDYGVIFEDRPTWFVAVWLALLAVGVALVLRTRRDLVNLTVVLLVVAAVQAVPPATEIASYQADHPEIAATDARLWPTDLEPPVVASGTPLPDIFVISPDDYARPDILQQYFGYDDSEFLAQLEQRGFIVSDESRSPYSYSEMNIAALLNLDYLTNFADVLGTDSEDFNLVKRVTEDNRAARLLASVGYEYVHLDTDEVTFVGGNPGISPFAAPDSFASLWLNKSILGQARGPLGFNERANNERFRDSIRSEFSELRSIQPGDRPKFVVFHTLIPHDPFIFDANGDDLAFPSNADHTGRVGMEYYVRQLEYVNQQLLDTIDAIQANADTSPVIVIEADEGFEVDPEIFGEEATADIRVKGLSAFSLPGIDEPGVAMPANSVNVLRYVFNQYLGTDYEMLDTVSHLEGELPFDFTEIPVE